MSNIVVTHADSGLVHASVVRTERVSPHVQRVTLGGHDVERLEWLGFDQWVRLALPVAEETRFDGLSDRFGLGGYFKYLSLPRGTRPVIRNYTLRRERAVGPSGGREIDVDFVVHGDQGVAGPWSVAARPGERVALIDQGCGWRPVDGAHASLVVADESAMPAALGVLRDLDPDARGRAIIEVFDEADRQSVEAPAGFAVDWVVRDPHAAPGSAALAALRAVEASAAESWLGCAPAELYAFCVGEQALATGARRHLVNELGVPKRRVTFSGYWRRRAR